MNAESRSARESETTAGKRIKQLHQLIDSAGESATNRKKAHEAIADDENRSDEERSAARQLADQESARLELILALYVQVTSTVEVVNATGESTAAIGRAIHALEVTNRSASTQTTVLGTIALAISSASVTLSVTPNMCVQERVPLVASVALAFLIVGLLVGQFVKGREAG